MAYEIEKNVQPLKGRNPRLKPEFWNYPLPKMKVGDSFLSDITYNKNNIVKLRYRIRTLLQKAQEEGKMVGWEFSTGKDPKGGKNIRVWRTV